MKTIFFLLCSLVYFNLHCYANSKVNNIYSLTKRSLDTAISEIISKNSETISSLSFTTTNEEYDSFLEPILLQILQERGINYLGKLPIKNSVHLRMQIEEFSLKWKNLEQIQDSLEEYGVLQGRIIATFPSIQPYVVYVNSSFLNTVSIPDAKRRKNGLPSSIVSEIPSASTSFVEEILTPVLYLGTAVITLLLLFTVRTQ